MPRPTCHVHRRAGDERAKRSLALLAMGSRRGHRNRCMTRRSGGRRDGWACCRSWTAVDQSGGGLLFRGRRERRGHGDVPQLSLDLARVEPGAGGAPVFGRELEVTVARPVREDLDDLAEVRVEVVSLARGDEGQAPGHLSIDLTFGVAAIDLMKV
jgi:hypothetical protein